MSLECYKSLTGNLDEIELIANAAESLLVDSDPTGRIQCNAMTRAALVLLCGYFEGFIRDLAEEYIEIIADEGFQLSQLPDPLFCGVVEDMVERLRSSKGGGVHSFKSAMQPGGKAEINKKRFSKTGGNPTVEAIEAIFEGLGAEAIIDRLSIVDYQVDSTFTSESQVLPAMRVEIQTALKATYREVSPSVEEAIIALIEKKWTPRRKRRKVGYVNHIEQLLKKRNRIAHGEGSEQITPTELIEFLERTRLLCKGLHSTVETLISALREPA